MKTFSGKRRKSHGPDEKARRANLRLDQRDGATRVLNANSGRRAIIAGDPDNSELIYLHMLGAVSQADTFDYKPVLEKTHGQELPASVRGNMRLSTMVQGQTSLGRSPSSSRAARAAR